MQAQVLPVDHRCRCPPHSLSMTTGPVYMRGMDGQRDCLGQKGSIHQVLSVLMPIFSLWGWRLRGVRTQWSIRPDQARLDHG